MRINLTPAFFVILFLAIALINSKNKNKELEKTVEKQNTDIPAKYRGSYGTDSTCNDTLYSTIDSLFKVQ